MAIAVLNIPSYGWLWMTCLLAILAAIDSTGLAFFVDAANWFRVAFIFSLALFSSKVD
jgi:hypothetical protein